ncbi:type II secretion system protein GspK [Caulobacter endophyticus]|uniref:type II secretion system protein GspK n=1 Tax=Caulobacter endophyticus TaxID=2172652 RepID=UPI00240FD4DE|nr:type II secretion system protein GspK [Caulobacter endophyticus]MDG2527267.1 type II secretion system protein GspK [Caulobacter endophyticus]
MTQQLDRGGRKGSALVPVMVSVLIFSYLAYAVLAADRGATASFDAQISTARLEAAADAGVATAIHRLASRDAARRWSIDGRPHRLDVQGIEVVVSVEDERGKAPINLMGEAELRRLFEAAGAPGPGLDRLVDGVMDWRDNGDRVAGQSLRNAQRGVRPRLGPIRSVDELAEIDGVDPALLDAIRPAVTLFFGDGPFSPRTAHPLALAAMTAAGADSPDAIARAREIAGQRTALEVSTVSQVGRALTLRLTARDGRGRVFRRTVVAELTGNRATPFWIRAVD